MNREIKVALLSIVAFSAVFASSMFCAKLYYEDVVHAQKLENIRLSIRNDNLTITNEMLIEENDKLHWQLENIEPSNDK